MGDRVCYPLARKVTFVTGAGGGLGGSLARVLVARGAFVALVDIDATAVAAVAADLPAERVMCLTGDVTDITSMQAAVAVTIERFGHLDVVVANAGILGRPATIRSLTPDEIGRVLDVNVTGVAHTVSAAIEAVIATRGQVVLISSAIAFANPGAATPYAMSKAAVAQLGQGLRMELAPHGASALTAYFALIDTDMIHHGIDRDAGARAVLQTAPGGADRRIPSVEAAAAIADGLEARASSVFRPRALRPMTALQGVVGPAMTHRATRHRGVQSAILALDQPASSERLQPIRTAKPEETRR